MQSLESGLLHYSCTRALRHTSNSLRSSCRRVDPGVHMWSLVGFATVEAASNNSAVTEVPPPYPSSIENPSPQVSRLSCYYPMTLLPCQPRLNSPPRMSAHRSEHTHRRRGVPSPPACSGFSTPRILPHKCGTTSHPASIPHNAFRNFSKVPSHF